MSKVAIIGAGAWGTALALHAARLGHDVSLWARHALPPTRQSPRLPGITLPGSVRLVAELERADATLVAVPMQHLRGVLAALQPAGPLVLCCKGLELGTSLLPLEVTAEIMPGAPACILSGPNFAREVATGLPAASVLAGGGADLRARLLGLLGGGALRLYGNADALGVQLGGAAKNVIAVAAGAVIGAGLGENARAALVTRGLAELSRLIAALGGRPETASGLSCMGDLVLTCTGPTSRNFALGHSLGGGGSLVSLCLPHGPVIEAVSTTPALLARAAGVDMPICETVGTMLERGRFDADLISRLMMRPARDE